MEYKVKDNIIISDKEKLIDSLYYLTGHYIDLEQILNFALNQKATFFYLDEKMNGVSENDTHKAKFLWIDTGLKKFDKPVFMSLINMGETFEGYYTGTARTLSNNMINYNPKYASAIMSNAKKFETKYEWKSEERTVCDLTNIYPQNNNTVHEKTTDDNVKKAVTEIKTVELPLTEQVRSRLMMDNWQEDTGLERYLKVIGCRLMQLIQQQKEEYYTLNNIKSAVVNTGLLNKFGTDILLMYRYNKSIDGYEMYKIVEGKNDLLEEKFTKEQASKQLKPISFFDSNNFFSADINDFDINYTSLSHIIESRRDRFPLDLQDLSENVIAEKILTALKLGLKMQQRDRTYVKPIYSTKSKAISWLMPLHIFKEFREEPELVLIVRQGQNYWEVKTILPYDNTMKDRITDLSLYHNMW